MAFLLPAAASIPGLLIKNWKVIGAGLLVLALGVQTLRLDHAKSDQYDRRSCVGGQPCKPPKWQAEARADEADINMLNKQHIVDQVSVSRLETAVAVQSAAAQALSEAGKAALAQAEAQVQAERQRTAGLRARLDRIAAPIAAKPGEDRCRVFDDTFLGTLP